MPGKRMRRMFEACCLVLMAICMAGYLAAVFVPARVSVPSPEQSTVSTQS